MSELIDAIEESKMVERFCSLWMTLPPFLGVVEEENSNGSKVDNLGKCFYTSFVVHCMYVIFGVYKPAYASSVQLHVHVPTAIR